MYCRQSDMPPASANDQRLTLMLRAIADPARRRILAMLKESRYKQSRPCAGDIEQRLGLSQSTISHHMAILRRAGLVEAAKQGTWIWYRRREAGLRELQRMVRKAL